MAATDASGLVHHGRSPLDRLQHMLHRYPVISPTIVLVVAYVVFALLNDRFASAQTNGIMLQQTAVLATLAIGQTLIILTAGIDLAIGTAMLLVHLVMARSVADGIPFLGVQASPLAALVIGILLGMVLGAIHGGFVTRLALPPFIVTLGTFYVFQSIGLVYSDAQTIPGDAIGRDTLLLWTGEGLDLFGMRITTGVLVTIVLYLVVGYVLANTAWGRHVYAVGDDAEAARLAGIDVRKVLISVYVTAGVFYALGGWVQLGRSLSASANAATDINLASITAVVIGGTSLFGGRGRLFGTLVGALIVTVFRVGLSLAGVDAYFQNLAIGSLILFAVGLDQWIRKVGA